MRKVSSISPKMPIAESKRVVALLVRSVQWINFALIATFVIPIHFQRPTSRGLDEGRAVIPNTTAGIVVGLSQSR